MRYFWKKCIFNKDLMYKIDNINKMGIYYEFFNRKWESWLMIL